MSLVRIRCMFSGLSARVQSPWTNRGLCMISSLRREDQNMLMQNNNNYYIKHFSSVKKDGDENLSPTNLTRAQKLKKAVTEYGTTVIVFHVTISLASLGACYALVSSGLDVEQLLITLKVSDWVKGNTVLVSNAGTFAVAYAVHKVFAPVRITITLGSVPFIVNYLRQKGILKK